MSRRYEPPSRAILSEDGPPVRVRDVAAFAGFSKAKVMADAELGRIKLTWQRCGQRRWAFVERPEARRYLEEKLQCST